MIEIKSKEICQMHEQIADLAVKAGKIMLEASDKIYSIDEKSSNSDIVTEYDVRIQEFLFKELSILYPDARFLGEEGGADTDTDISHGRVFIIDPIDGTTNFVRNFNKSAVSVALCEDGKVIYGCCYNPYSNELYHATKDAGAFCNGKRICCASNPIEHSIASVGTTPYNKQQMGEATFGIMLSLFKNAMDVRRFGSAVIDLLDVACGKSDLFCEMRLSPWDYAAAGFIAECAGAVVTDMNGDKLKYDGRYSVLAASKQCYEFFMHC